MLPLWAHAFQSRSILYSDQKLFDAQIYRYSGVGLKLESIGLPISAMNGYTNFNTSVSLGSVINEGLEIALPYFHYIPDNENNKIAVKNVIDNKLSLLLNNDPLKIKMDQTNAYCIDYFNPAV